MGDFKKLQVWQKAHALARSVFVATRSLVRDREYALADQMKRAAISVGANIAEGCDRYRGRDFLRFLAIASASANELESHLLLARDAGLLPSPEVEEMISAVCEVRRMLSGLRRRIAESA